MCVSFGRGLCLCDGRRKNENDDSNGGMSSVAFFVMSIVFFVCVHTPASMRFRYPTVSQSLSFSHLVLREILTTPILVTRYVCLFM